MFSNVTTSAPSGSVNRPCSGATLNVTFTVLSSGSGVSTFSNCAVTVMYPTFEPSGKWASPVIPNVSAFASQCPSSAPFTSQPVNSYPSFASTFGTRNCSADDSGMFSYVTTSAPSGSVNRPCSGFTLNVTFTVLSSGSGVSTFSNCAVIVTYPTFDPSGKWASPVIPNVSAFASQCPSSAPFTSQPVNSYPSFASTFGTRNCSADDSGMFSYVTTSAPSGSVNRPCSGFTLNVTFTVLSSGSGVSTFSNCAVIVTYPTFDPSGKWASPVIPNVSAFASQCPSSAPFTSQPVNSYPSFASTFGTRNCSADDSGMFSYVTTSAPSGSVNRPCSGATLNVTFTVLSSGFGVSISS